MKQHQEATFSKIDMESWERKEYFLHYYNDVRCTYSVTVNVDITEIYNRVKDNGLRLYPTLIWWIANAVNHFEFLRFNQDEDGNIGYYNEVNPSFASCRREATNSMYYGVNMTGTSRHSMTAVSMLWTPVTRVKCSRWLICRRIALIYPLCRG